MTRMGHDNERAALIYQHAARGADQTITDAIDAHVQAEQRRPGRRAQTVRWALAPPANGTLIARRAVTIVKHKAQLGDHGPDLGLRVGAGDGNRTRTISLGS